MGCNSSKGVVESEQPIPSSKKSNPPQPSDGVPRSSIQANIAKFEQNSPNALSPPAGSPQMQPRTSVSVSARTNAGKRPVVDKGGHDLKNVLHTKKLLEQRSSGSQGNAPEVKPRQSISGQKEMAHAQLGSRAPIDHSESEASEMKSAQANPRKSVTNPASAVGTGHKPASGIKPEEHKAEAKSEDVKVSQPGSKPRSSITSPAGVVAGQRPKNSNAPGEQKAEAKSAEAVKTHPESNPRKSVSSTATSKPLPSTATSSEETAKSSVRTSDEKSSPSEAKAQENTSKPRNSVTSSIVRASPPPAASNANGERKLEVEAKSPPGKPASLPPNKAIDDPPSARLSIAIDDAEQNGKGLNDTLPPPSKQARMEAPPPVVQPSPRKSTTLPPKTSPSSNSSTPTSKRNSVVNSLSGLSKAEQMKLQREMEDKKQKEAADEMERLRVSKLKQLEQKLSVEQQSFEEEKRLEDERQAMLRRKAEEIKKEEDSRIAKREAEQKKVREAEEVNDKKREADRAHLKKKIDGGRRLSIWEETMAKEMGLLAAAQSGNTSPTAASPEDDANGEGGGGHHRRHSSMMTEKPQVRKMSESFANNDAIQVVMKTLEKAQEEKAEANKTLSTIEPIIEDLRLQDPNKTEFQFNGSPFFGQWANRDEKKDENSVNLANAVGSHPYLVKIEMYASSLDDQFALTLAAQISAGNMKSMESLHLESNCFSGKGMTAIFQALQDPEKAPNLRTAKMANQKFQMDNAAEQAALEMLKTNPKITKLTVDWKKTIDMAECSRLLARNANLSKRNGSLSVKQ
eukprot:TRINITY_DN10384_c0_g1_i1.p1 TRINITY_DN10384_c0_g1~~TRINITY_DN10384_c0_g1_i1.p1  ORF type:complete len:798 (+),score=214.71 TRINITY_DN10384_c0_g1_i1:69-2462(+)